MLEAVRKVHVPTLPPALLLAAVLPEARAAVHRRLLQVPERLESLLPGSSMLALLTQAVHNVQGAHRG